MYIGEVNIRFHH